uniref:C2 calcium-dependent domain-containing protein 4A n=1 Tax=Jaculus jaculus TaxID=51337 RepID=UPI001E1B329D|nr:C2 calcium-dependent domain-containing protein 4A [Jaculus jaculus]
MWCLERLLRDGHGLLPGRARRAKTRSPSAACANVLTPDRIPEFCIPPRIEPSLALTALRNSWGGEAERDDGAGRTDWDPRSQAALSLPHLPRARTAYGFCALLESPHTRRKESLLLGGPGAPRPRAHTYCGAADAPLAPRPAPAPAASPDAPLAPRPRGRRLLRVADGLLSRALRVRGAPRRARARSVPSGHEDDVRAPAPPPADPRPERLQAEGTVSLGRAGGALRLAAEYSPASGRLRIRLLRPEGPAAALEPRAVGCRLSLVLRPPAAARPPRGLVLARSRKASWERDCCFDGLSEDEVRRLAVRVKAESRGRGLERRRALGQGELPLGELLRL